VGPLTPIGAFVDVRFSANFDKTSELVKEAVPALKTLELVRAWEEMP
jgi:hypothetical protein